MLFLSNSGQHSCVSPELNQSKLFQMNLMSVTLIKLLLSFRPIPGMFTKPYLIWNSFNLMHLIEQSSLSVQCFQGTYLVLRYVDRV